jgi:hypothetical protein
MMSKKRIEQLRDQLKWLQSRHDSSAVNTATYNAIKSLEKDIAWNEHQRQFLNRVLSSDAASFLECDLIEFEPGGESTPQRTSGSSSIAENAGPSSEMASCRSVRPTCFARPPSAPLIPPPTCSPGWRE